MVHVVVYISPTPRAKLSFCNKFMTLNCISISNPMNNCAMSLQENETINYCDRTHGCIPPQHKWRPTCACGKDPRPLRKTSKPPWPSWGCTPTMEWAKTNVRAWKIPATIVYPTENTVIMSVATSLHDTSKDWCVCVVITHDYCINSQNHHDHHGDVPWHGMDEDNHVGVVETRRRCVVLTGKLMALSQQSCYKELAHESRRSRNNVPTRGLVRDSWRSRNEVSTRGMLAIHITLTTKPQ